MKKFISVLCAIAILTIHIPLSFAADDSVDEMREYESLNKIDAAIKGTPVIDAKVDDIWNETDWTVCENWKLISILKTDTKGVSQTKFKTMWDVGHLYILIKVETPKLNFENVNSWEKDSVDIFVDQDCSRYANENDNIKFRIDGQNNVYCESNVKPNNIVSANYIDETGYMLEISLDIPMASFGAYSKIGFELQTNETSGNAHREYISSWNDYNEDKATNRPWRWGTLVFVDDKSQIEDVEKESGTKREPISKIYNNIKITLNDIVQQYDVKPLMYNDILYAPYGKLLESLGVTLSYDRHTGRIDAQKDGVALVFTVNSDVVTLNGSEVKMPGAVLMRDNQVYLPLRFVCENFGFYVKWNDDDERADIQSESRYKITLDNWIDGSDISTVYPSESWEFIKNPYKGWGMHGGFDTPNIDYSDDVWENASMFYVRLDWKKVNPKKGVYEFDKLIPLLEFAESKNMTVSFGFSPVNVNDTKIMGKGSNNSESAPEFLFDDGCAYTLEGGGDVRCPVWNDPLYYEYYKEFIEEFAKRFDGDKRIYFVENRFFGNWGEWHLGKLDNSEHVTYENAVKFIDAFDCFKKTRVALVGSPKWKSLIDYAIFDKGYMTKKDGFVNPNHTSVFTHGKNYIGQTPYAGEWYGLTWGYQEQMDRDVWDDTLIEYTIKETGLTILNYTSREKDTARFVSEQLDTIKRLGNFFGYWFRPTKIAYSNNIGNGEKGSFAIKIKNDGYAPYYGDRTNTGYMKLALLDKENNVIDSVLLDDVNIHYWQPGEYSTVISDFEFNYNPKASKLAVGLFTDKDLTNPNIRLGISDKSVNNWYIVNDMNKTQSEKVSRGRIYSESSMASDRNYGYYSGRYAFDDDETTFWRSVSTNFNTSEQWVEIDFGEKTDFSSLEVIENDERVTSWVLKYEDENGNWLDAAKGTKLSGNLFEFPTVSTKKARLVIKDADEYAEISEIKLWK